MKPLGRKYYCYPGKTDHHIREKGYVNWWEVAIPPDKRRERQENMKEIRKEMDSYASQSSRQIHNLLIVSANLTLSTNYGDL